jgi:hypothetical protein
LEKIRIRDKPTGSAILATSMYNHAERKEALLKYFAGHLDALFLEGGAVLQHLPATDELQHLRALPHQLSHLHPVKRQSQKNVFGCIRER